MKTLSDREREDAIPNQDLNVSVREIHALLQYMDFTFEHEGIDEFFEGFSQEDDEVWDEKATRSIYKKLLQKSNYFYREGYLGNFES
tara:strand:+ start:318 stop:578 length:261 start_codon:yes stop_codon:yes gene_type:complete